MGVAVFGSLRKSACLKTSTFRPVVSLLRPKASTRPQSVVFSGPEGSAGVDVKQDQSGLASFFILLDGCVLFFGGHATHVIEAHPCLLISAKPVAIALCFAVPTSLTVVDFFTWLAGPKTRVLLCWCRRIRRRFVALFGRFVVVSTTCERYNCKHKTHQKHR